MRTSSRSQRQRDRNDFLLTCEWRLLLSRWLLSRWLLSRWLDAVRRVRDTARAFGPQKYCQEFTRSVPSAGVFQPHP
jgi:hypothetical protein